MFVEELYKLIDTEQSIDYIFDHINNLCWQENWDEIDNILASLDINRLSLDAMVAFLSITLCVKSKLKNRASFFYTVASFSIDKPKLLVGLE